MKRLFLVLSLCIMNYALCIAQIGTWRNYLSYAEPQQIQAASNDLFVLASGSLYLYNKQDQSIYTYDKTNGMSDVDITHIKWCPQAKRLVVVYSDSNIDLVEVNGNVTNVNDIYARAITGGKTIYSITINGQYAYLACEFGIIKINVKDAEISETYQLGFPVNAVSLDKTNIYANSSTKGIWTAALTSNLIDPANWTPSTITPDFTEDLSDYNNNIELVKTLQPGGPKYNWFDYLKFTNCTLYSVAGKHLDYTLSQRDGIIQTWNGKEWNTYEEHLENVTGFEYKDVTCIDVDPNDPKHVCVTSSHSGIYEFYNEKLLKYYNADNSILYPVGGQKNMLLTDGLVFDKEGNLWVISGWSKTMLLKISPDNQWVNFFDQHSILQEKRNKLGNLLKPIIDSRNILWFVNSYWEYPALISYDINNDVVKIFDNFVNQDGTTYNVIHVYGVREDLDGNIWVTTEIGPFYLEPSEIYKDNYTFTQVKVPRNDGTDYADYLLTGIPIYDIIVDSANRKWFTTENNGVYLITADNMSQLHHFTSNNSELLSDKVFTCTINNNNGEVFFATDKGLCSFISDATASNTEMTKDNVWAYPNPVQPDYTGLITITGLTYNADVKILATNGAVIAEGRSNGGSFIWDGCNKSGQRVASGVYMVATATKDGSKGTVCKIAVIR